MAHTATKMGQSLSSVGIDSNSQRRPSRKSASRWQVYRNIWRIRGSFSNTGSICGINGCHVDENDDGFDDDDGVDFVIEVDGAATVGDENEDDQNGDGDDVDDANDSY